MLQIQDPVHGSISLDGMYADIVNTPEFQRLRSIEQVSFRPAYPGARHDRFIHSLGTYHLATKFVEHFFRNLNEDLGITVSADEAMKLKTTFCYAALLHDIGHAPFSHTTEGFFQLPQDPNDPDTPLIWAQLCEAIRNVAPQEYALFRNPRKKTDPGKLPYGAPHEVASSVILVSNWNRFLFEKDLAAVNLKVDLALAARMVIGYTYDPSDLKVLEAQADITALGIRNCLIQLINSSVLDVDRLDYLGRDTLMTGFVNAPVDLDTLASSVTAVKLDNGILAPAYRDSALRVFDLMFQAKLSHDDWVIANPAAVYEAALREHCIRELYKNNKDLDAVFSVDALSRNGVTLNGKSYRLLSDLDVEADLKAQSGAPYDELYTRELGRRRIAAWHSYYEFHHIFSDPANGLTPEDVCVYFNPLLEYMKNKKIFIFNAESYETISASKDPKVTLPAAFLRDFLRKPTDESAVNENYDAVLLSRSNNLTMTEKVDPEQIRIVFPKKHGQQRFLITRADGRSYSTYGELTGITLKDVRSRGYFHLFRYGVLGPKQRKSLRTRLVEALNIARDKGLLKSRKE